MFEENCTSRVQNFLENSNLYVLVVEFGSYFGQKTTKNIFTRLLPKSSENISEYCSIFKKKLIQISFIY